MKQRTQPFRPFVIRWERLKADLPNRRRFRKFVTLAAAPRNEYLAPGCSLPCAPPPVLRVLQPILCGSLLVLCWFPQVKKNGGACEYCISAIQHLRPLRGGAQAHLLKASDGACYVTKFQNNPQHIRVLANEMLATNLGLALGLPMPRVEVIEVSDWLIEHDRRSSNQSWWCQDSVPERQTIGIAVRGLRESGHDIRLLASRAAGASS